MIGDDLTPFFVAGEFAGADDTLDGVKVVGMFDAAFATAGDGIGMATTRPAYTLPTSEAGTDPEGKMLVANGGTYRVVAHEPDGAGVSLLILENA